MRWKTAIETVPYTASVLFETDDEARAFMRVLHEAYGAACGLLRMFPVDQGRGWLVAQYVQGIQPLAVTPDRTSIPFHCEGDPYE